MQIQKPSFSALGESALIVRWDNRIDRMINHQVNRLAKTLRAKPFPGLVDLVPAYSSLAVLYDPRLIRTVVNDCNTANEYVHEQVALLVEEGIGYMEQETQLIEIPVCYDTVLGNDLAAIASFSGLSIEEVITKHADEAYYVYMPGFLPGFAYMGDVNGQIAIPRKQKPASVHAGAVGIAGRQTGIYPVDSPGGWHIVGYTPLLMFDKYAPSPCLLEAGKMVKFHPIDAESYYARKKQYER